MVIVAVEVLLVGSKPLAAVSVHIFTGETHGFDAASPIYVNQDGIPARESGRFSFHTGTGRTWADLDPFCRIAIPIIRLICFSVLHKLT